MQAEPGGWAGGGGGFYRPRTPKAIGHHQQLGESSGAECPSEGSEAAQPADTSSLQNCGHVFLSFQAPWFLRAAPGMGAQAPRVRGRTLHRACAPKAPA